jgi:hypothetical protein
VRNCMRNHLRIAEPNHENTTILYLPDGSRHRANHGSIAREDRSNQVVVTGAFPIRNDESGVLVELIRDRENPDRLAFLEWKNGVATLHPQIEQRGKIFVPPDPTSRSFPMLSLATNLAPFGKASALLAEIQSTISKFVELHRDQLLIIACFILMTWVSDCLEMAPYLWVVGPFGSAKTTLLKLCSCMCRRGLIAGDLRAASIYKLVDTWQPTLIIDELEVGNSGASAELLRLLRNGTTPDVPVYRNGQRFVIYGPKIVATRQPVSDAALMSRGLTVSLLPTKQDLLPLDDAAMKQIAAELQPKLLMFRLQNFSSIKNSRISPDLPPGMTPRAKQVARALALPLLGNPHTCAELFAILTAIDEQSRIDRSLEPEWLVTEALFDICHEGLESGEVPMEILVGGIAVHANQRLDSRGEDVRFGARKVGAVLQSLGLRTQPLGRLGRGLRLDLATRRQIHVLALHMGIDRRAIASLTALERGQAVPRCSLCEEIGLNGGLESCDIPRPRQKRATVRRYGLFDEKDTACKIGRTKIR